VLISQMKLKGGREKESHTFPPGVLLFESLGDISSPFAKDRTVYGVACKRLVGSRDLSRWFTSSNVVDSSTQEPVPDDRLPSKHLVLLQHQILK